MPHQARIVAILQAAREVHIRASLVQSRISDVKGTESISQILSIGEQPFFDLADELHYYLSNGDDGYCLTMGTEADHVLVDCIGDFGTDPGSGWPVAGVNNATKDHTLVRKSSVVSGNGGDWVTSAGTSADDSEWIVYDQNTWTYLGEHTMDELDHSYFSENFETLLQNPHPSYLYLD